MHCLVCVAKLFLVNFNCTFQFPIFSGNGLFVTNGYFLGDSIYPSWVTIEKKTHDPKDGDRVVSKTSKEALDNGMEVYL